MLVNLIFGIVKIKHSIVINAFKDCPLYDFSMHILHKRFDQNVLYACLIYTHSFRLMLMGVASQPQPHKSNALPH
jgi:hypothetical protein